MKQRRPMRQKSEKQKEIDKEFEAAKRRVLNRDRYECQAFTFFERADPAARELAVDADFPAACDRHNEAHHLVSRRVRALAAVDDNLVTLCDAHHDWIHDESPAAAVAIGLLESVSQVRDD